MKSGETQGFSCYYLNNGRIDVPNRVFLGVTAFLATRPGRPDRHNAEPRGFEVHDTLAGVYGRGEADGDRVLRVPPRNEEGPRNQTQVLRKQVLSLGSCLKGAACLSDPGWPTLLRATASYTILRTAVAARGLPILQVTIGYSNCAGLSSPQRFLDCTMLEIQIRRPL